VTWNQTVDHGAPQGVIERRSSDYLGHQTTTPFTEGELHTR